jgi:hypothetical protein
MKVDVTKIEGYADMTADEKVAALEGFEMPDADFSGYVKKDLFDKTSSELADLKKKQRDALSEEERRKAEADDRLADLQSKYDALLRESQISKSKAQYLSIGYSEELAEKAAVALFDGDTEALFEVQKSAKSLIEENLKKELIKGTSKPVGNGGSQTMTLDAFRKLTPGERASFAAEHPEEYKLLYGGN